MLRNKITYSLIASSVLLALFTTFSNAQAPRSLANGRLVACQAREASVKTRMESLVDLVANIESKFETIALRVENFYTNKVVPSGKTVSNYSVLVANIDTQKGLVSSSLTKAESDVSAFSCTADDPKGLLNTFRLDMQTVKSALQSYRTSIKNLIVAVHSVSPTPIPTPTP